MSESKLIGCGDNSCIFVRPKGPGTNGGCRCAREPGRLAHNVRVLRRQRDELLAALKAEHEGRARAYYYSFEPTGVPEIDMILSAVECAGPSCGGQSAVEWIQTAAHRAADSIRRTRAIDSAAPELLAALKEARQYVMLYSPSGKPFDFPKETIDHIDAAIARGGPQR